MSKKSFKPQTGFQEAINNDSINKIEKICIKWAEEIGASSVLLPIVEKKSLYERSVGEGTDVVDKEMIKIISEKEDLVLRPEGTSGIMRLWNNQGGRNIGSQKWYYSDFMFRNERPQAGRYKQFKQFGLEIIGQKEGIADIEILCDIYRLFKTLKIENKVTLKINNIGDAQERSNYKRAFMEWIEPKKEQLDDKSLDKLYKNPLRILDSKDEKTKKLISESPKIRDFINSESIKKWERFISLLNEMKIPYEVDDNLMRGLDYYNGLVFEWVSNQNDGAQNAIAAGGRYDSLSSSIGGEDTPALGFAIGMERVALISDNQPENKREGVYISWVGDVEEFVLKIKQIIINKDIGFVIVDNGSKGLTKQIKKADEKMFKYLIAIGENEKLSGRVMIKDLSNGTEKEIGITSS